MKRAMFDLITPFPDLITGGTVRLDSIYEKTKGDYSVTTNKVEIVCDGAKFFDGIQE